MDKMQVGFKHDNGDKGITGFHIRMNRRSILELERVHINKKFNLRLAGTLTLYLKGKVIRWSW